MGVAAFVRLIVIFLLSPGTDVFYYDRQAAQVLLALQNPYSHLYKGIPSQFATPGAEKVFAYLPFTALYMVPFYLVGEIRIGFVFADLLIGAILYSLSKGKSTMFSIYLFAPFTVLFSTVYLNNSLISLLFIGLFILLENRGSGTLAAFSFGIALASVQFSWLLLPFVLYYYGRRRRWKDSIVAVTVAVLIFVPFIVASPGDFFEDIVNFQFARPTLNLITHTGPFNYNINLSLNGFLLTFLNSTLSRSVRLTLAAALTPFFAFRLRSFERLLVRSAGFVLAVIFVLPNDFFWAYTELPFLLFLAYISLRRSNPSREHLHTADTNRAFRSFSGQRQFTH